MHREGHLFFFNESERETYPGLQEWVPEEGIVAIYEEVVNERALAAKSLQIAQSRDVHDLSEADRQVEISDANDRASKLELLRREIAKHAAPEIAAANADSAIEDLAGIEGLDLTRLHEK